MPFTFGPLPSRRLGMSLGIDLVPNKTCNYTCVYCQLGRTTNYTNTRASYFDPEKIWAEIGEKLQKLDIKEINYITIVGNGEPTLSLDIGWCIRKIKREYSLPVAVITNGALLYVPQVRADLAAADVVLPTLDAGTEDIFRIINRPHNEITLNKVISGLEEFRNKYNGQIWLEVMLVRDVNDSPQKMHLIADAIHRCNPDRIYVNVPIRPPAESWVHVPSLQALHMAKKIFPGCNIIDFPESGYIDLPGQNATELHENLVQIVKSHPLKETQILEILKRKNCANPTYFLEEALSLGQLREFTYEGVFYIQFVDREDE